jgi:DNA-binding transcriptional ArsR family regulator
MADRGKGKKDRRKLEPAGSRGVLREIDERLAAVDGELEAYRELVAERNRLAAARAALTGTRAPAGLSASRGRRVSQDEIAEFLAEHPGSKAGDIARAFEVPLTNVSQHLYRGKQGRFEARGDGWYLRESSD